MQQYHETEEKERLEFARLAAKHFEENPLHVNFTKSGPVHASSKLLPVYRPRQGKPCD